MAKWLRYDLSIGSATLPAEPRAARAGDSEMALSEAAKKAIIRAIAKSKARREKDAKAWAEKGVLPETSNSVSVRLKTGTLEEIADFLKTIAPDLLQCGNVMWPKSNAWGLSFPHSMSAEEAEKDRQWTAYARTFAR